MKRRTFWIALLTCLIVTSLVLASCNKTTTATKTTATAQVSSTTTTAAGNWWDSLGQPQYGGEINYALTSDISVFDPYYAGNSNYVTPGWMEKSSISSFITFRAPAAWPSRVFPRERARAACFSTLSSPSTIPVQ